jgi:hypothetical protein
LATLADSDTHELETAWETLGRWSLDAVTRASPIVVGLCPDLPRDQAARLLRELADDLLDDGRLDRFAVCRGCRPRRRGARHGND